MYIFVVSKKTFFKKNCFMSVWIITSSKRRSSSLEVFYKIDLLKNFPKFTAKSLS